MKFLGGFLKFIGILLMLIGTAAGAGLCVFGAMEEMWEPVMVGVGIFLSFLFVALGVLGTGMALSQIVKLKKKVAQLEQRLWHAPAAPVAAPVAEPVATPEIAPAQPVVPVVEPAEKAPKAGDKSRIAVIIASVVAVIAIVLVIVIAIGGNKNTPQQVPALREEDTQQAVELPPVDMAETEAPEEVAPIEVVELPVGSSLSTGFVDMTFDEFIVEEDIQKSVTIDHVTRTTGPEPLPGQVYICLSGTIKATSGTALPVYDFFEGRFQIGDYSYSVSANDCDVLSPDGSPESTIDPLLVYEYRIYTAIPEELHEYIAAGENCSFTFGFYDMFDNQELSYNRAFGDDPIASCPYQYIIPVN